MKGFLFVILLGGLLGLGRSARAEILFLGFNPAEGEIKVVEQIARERGEKLITFPRPDPALIARHAALTRERERLSRAEDRAKDQELAKITARMAEIDHEIEELETALEGRPGALEALLEELAAAGTKLSSVVISGHDGNGDFWGPYGRISSENLTALFKKYPALHAETRSLALLGCYTSTVGALETYWKGVIPSVRIVGGYGGSGPLASQKLGHEYLRAFLRRDQKLGAAKTPQELMSQFKSLPAVRQLTAAIATREALANGSSARSIEDYYKDCEKIDTNSPLRKTYDCYVRGDQGCEDPPRDTKKGVLRQFYNEVHGMDHCRALLTIKGDAGLPAGKEVLALLYFHAVRENFSRIHAGELKTVSALLQKLGIESEFARKIEDVSIPRARLKTWLQDLQSRVKLAGEALPKVAESQAAFLDSARAARWLEVIHMIILERSARCVSSTWVDPGAKVPSFCMKETHIENHALTRWKSFIGKDADDGKDEP